MATIPNIFLHVRLYIFWWFLFICFFIHRHILQWGVFMSFFTMFNTHFISYSQLSQLKMQSSIYSIKITNNWISFNFPYKIPVYLFLLKHFYLDQALSQCFLFHRDGREGHLVLWPWLWQKVSWPQPLISIFLKQTFKEYGVLFSILKEAIKTGRCNLIIYLWNTFCTCSKQY